MSGFLGTFHLGRFFNGAVASTSEQRGEELFEMLHGTTKEDFDEKKALKLVREGVTLQDPKRLAFLLTASSLYGHEATADALLEKQIIADINAQDIYGDIALSNAAFIGNDHIVRALKQHGAAGDVPTRSGKTAFRLAEEGRRPETYMLLASLYPEDEKVYREKGDPYARNWRRPTNSDHIKTS